MDPLEYLQDGFNPSKYKVAELRNVLLQNDITFPSAAKKQMLIDLFNEHIKPTAAQKLKELEAVVATDDRIEVVDHKLKVPKRKSKASTPEVEELPSPKRSPRKVSKGKVEKIGELGKIPDLGAGSLQHPRERSPRRSSARAEDRERSPAKAKPETEIISQELKKTIKSPRKIASSKSPSKITKPKRITKIGAKDFKLSDDDEEGVELVSKQEFEAIRSPFKVDRLESSFTNDNIFQSPAPDSPEFKPKKTIPKKRGTSESPKKPTRPLKKTAFSSSPDPIPRSASPLKKSLAISKFEENDSFSEKFTDDIFDVNGDDEVDKDANDPKDRQAEDDVFDVDGEDDHPIASQTTINHIDDFSTPNEGNASRISLNTSVQGTTPSKTPYGKVQSSIRDNLTSWLKSSPKTPVKTPTKTPVKFDATLETPIKTEDHEILEAEEPETSIDGLSKLQKEMESTFETVLKESEDAVKQINEIFNDEEDIVGEDVAAEPGKPWINWCSILNFFKHVIIFFFFSALIIFGLWYREQRVLIGYCGSEIDTPTFPHTGNPYLVQLDSFLQEYKPYCLKCPEHAICLPKLKIKCKQDFIAKEPWYKFYGVLPFPGYCAKDQEKENIISEVVAKSLDLLRTRNAAISCGDGDDLEVGITDEELYDFFYKSKKSTIGDEEFNEIWSKVLEDLGKEPEITLRFLDDGPGYSKDHISTNESETETIVPQKKVIFRSTSGIKLSIGCKFKKEIYERFEANKYQLVGAFVGCILVISVYYKYTQYQLRQSKIKEISGIIITKLKIQQKNSTADPTGLTNRYLSTIQLRDELLSNLKTSERFKLWAGILKRLEGDSNIRSSSKEIHGDIVRVLEWIGE